ncbi:MAG: TPM domain-containing protein [Bradyrhizobiaceae bacterium]|nr:TPM domain-containing protein [Bradyrhizobiaceae bacterium]
MSIEDHERISAAIFDAEQRTSGEIVCVLARESADATALPMLLAALAAFAVPWVLLALTALPVNLILTLQLVTFFVLSLVLCMPRVRIALVPRAARRAMAHRMAMEQFVIRGIGRKADRTGVLIFVSLAERYARIVADRAIAERVSQHQWQAAVDALIAHTRDGHIADGFVTAVAMCGRVLEENFPRSETSRRELPNRIYVI